MHLLKRYPCSLEKIAEKLINKGVRAMSVNEKREILNKWIDTNKMSDEEIELLIKQLQVNWYGEAF